MVPGGRRPQPSPGACNSPGCRWPWPAAGPRALALAATHGQVWVTLGDPRRAAELDDAACQAVARAQSQALDAACEAIGRDPASIDRLYMQGATGEPWLASVEAYRGPGRALPGAGVHRPGPALAPRSSRRTWPTPTSSEPSWLTTPTCTRTRRRRQATSQEPAAIKPAAASNRMTVSAPVRGRVPTAGRRRGRARGRAGGHGRASSSTRAPPWSTSSRWWWARPRPGRCPRRRPS